MAIYIRRGNAYIRRGNVTKGEKTHL
jgi:hypothetical protein